MFRDLFKFGIVIFVVLTAVLGYALGFPVEANFSWAHLMLFILGLAAVSCGSFALNQTQEWRLDQKMPRTQGRPIPSGQISVGKAAAMGVVLTILGFVILFFRVSQEAALLAALTVLLYNGLYTIVWKMRTAFAAVPGAIPGAMPGLIGYAAVNNQLSSAPAVYLFLLMFLWQMPHFWSLAIRYKEDYRRGGVPVLPVVYGTAGTLYHSALYMMTYAGLVLLSPFFVEARLFYLVFVWPLTLKVLWEFVRFYRTGGEKGWGRFFLWINVSLLIFLLAPVLDKWWPFLWGEVNLP